MVEAKSKVSTFCLLKVIKAQLHREAPEVAVRWRDVGVTSMRSDRMLSRPQAAHISALLIESVSTGPADPRGRTLIWQQQQLLETFVLWPSDVRTPGV